MRGRSNLELCSQGPPNDSHNAFTRTRGLPLRLAAAKTVAITLARATSTAAYNLWRF